MPLIANLQMKIQHKLLRRQQFDGCPDPEPNDNPTEGRSSALTFAQKAISYFMPNKLMSWNVLANPPVGNPTKSVVVNNLIMIVNKREVRRQGKRSQARKPFTEDEYEFAMRKMDSCGEEHPGFNGHDWKSR